MNQESTSKRSGVVRKVIIAGGLLAAFLVLALVAPFLVDFSSFKPQIQAVVADHLNAKIDFESARLQVLPSIGVKVKGVSVINSDEVFNGTKLFAVESLVVEAQLLPLLSGKVVGKVKIDAPEFTMAKKGLKNNLTSLMKPMTPEAEKAAKEKAATDATEAAEKKAAEPAKDPKQEAADMAATMNTVKEKLLIEGVYINGANITIRDIEAKDAKEPVRVRDLNIAITNIGLDREILVKVDTKVDVNEAGAKVKGLIEITKTVKVQMGGNGLEKATFKGKLSYDDLMINFREAFVKATGIPLNVAFSGSFVPGDFILEELLFNLHNLNVAAKAHVVNFADPRLTAEVKVANENLASLGDLLPQHKQMLINGNMHLNASANGRISDLGALETKVDFDTKLAGTDLDVKLATKGVFPFKGKLAVNSQRIDLDSLLGPFLPKSTASQEPAKADAPEAQKTADAPKDGKPAAPVEPAKDFVLSDDLKKLIMGTDAEIRVSLKEIIFKALKLTNFKIDVDQKNLVASLNQFNIDGFGGKIFASGKVDLDANPIAFDGLFKLTEIHPEQVILVVKPEHKDLLKGRMNLELATKGKGTTVPTLNKTLNGQGSFKFLEGEMHTKSVASVMGDELDKFMTTLSVSGASSAIFDSAEKLLNSPLAKAAGKNPPDLEKLKQQYQSAGKMKFTDKSTANKSLKDVNGKIEIKEGKIFIVSTTTDSNGSMEFKSFVDLEMKLGGTSVFTASEAAKQRLKAQSQYADLLNDDKNNLVVPMTLGGTVMDPKVTIGSDAMKASFTKKAQALAEKEVKKAAEDYMKSLMGGGAQKAEANKKVEEAKTKAKDAAKNPENQKKAKEALKGLFGK